MTARIIIFDHAGNALVALDAHHGLDHAAAWVAENVAKIEARHGATPIVIEYDPVAGGDAARHTVHNIHEVRLDLHQRPDGKLEPIGIAHRTTHVASALRVLHAPDHVHGSRRTIRNKPGHHTERAQRWRGVIDPATQRVQRRLQRDRT